MKIIIRNISYIILFAILLSSCEDQIDRFPKDTLTPETFFTTRMECEIYTNELYPMFPGGGDIYGESADLIVKDALSDEVAGKRYPGNADSNWEFKHLRNINFFLQYSSNCKDEKVRLEYEGLVRFFRAYFYFEKVKRFGDVPWLDRALLSDDPELYKGRDPREFIMSKTLEDINFAIENLSNEKSIYRVTKWTALALKSRIFLFEGTYRKYHGLGDYEKYLEYSADAATIFLNTSGYKIYNVGNEPYLNLFASMKANETEIILARAYNTSIGLKHNVNGYVASTTGGRPGMTRNMANMYLMRDGTPYTQQPNWETNTFVDECNNRDLRFSQTVRTVNYKRIDGTNILPPDLSRSMTGYTLIKYATSDKYDSYNASMNDLPLFRTAEVYLNLAEAKAELGTLSQDDIEKVIKPLRDRAGIMSLNMANANSNPDPYLADAETGYMNVTGSNKGVILEIRRERTIELIMEGFRYWDIMRWKEGKRFEKDFLGLYFPGTGVYDLNGDGTNDVCIYVGTKPSYGSTVAYYELGKDIILSDDTSGYVKIHSDIVRKWIDPRDYLYPIPTEDRIITNGTITQNPGWNDGLPF